MSSSNIIGSLMKGATLAFQINDMYKLKRKLEELDDSGLFRQLRNSNKSAERALIEKILKERGYSSSEIEDRL